MERLDAIIAGRPLTSSRAVARVGEGVVVTDGPSTVATLYTIAGIVGMTTGAYHGYKRNNSVGWALGWALFGDVLPFISIPLSLAQGFGKARS